MTSVIVIVTRHPDFDNDIRVFGADDVHLYNVDYGRSNLSDENEYAAWRESHMEDVAALRAQGEHAAADYLEQAINEGEGVS